MAVKDKLVTLEDLQTAYNDLMEKMEEDMGVTKIALTLKPVSRVTWASDCILTLVKSGNIVQAIFNAKGTVTPGDNIFDSIIATVPSGFIPGNKYTFGPTGSTNSFSIMPNGDVVLHAIYAHSTTAVSFGLYNTGFYIAAD